MRPLAAILLHLIVLFGCENKSIEPTDAIERLKAGNARFLSGHPMHPHESLQRLRELKKGQHPFVVIVSCSDSRVPPELIFDQGFGDIFSIRTAGNIIGDYELGSIEYAVEHLGCKTIVVMGHSQCGAIKSFFETEGHYDKPDHIKSIIEYLNNEAEEQEVMHSPEKKLEKAVEANVDHGVKFLSESKPVLAPLVQSNKVKVVGAIYNIETGKVNFQ